MPCLPATNYDQHQPRPWWYGLDHMRCSCCFGILALLLHTFFGSILPRCKPLLSLLQASGRQIQSSVIGK
ncbi:hypothetical protein NDU88_002967 [Pleurodeles waltl]|uniref:Uncharacterized protein n=1 Tax=Pleurodeles waltl TaxID=8319 RepID=A0AAV7M246_PLEWA|nr:hypothetical protein NDU88_002967 [Pleurodeles waltl]